jgi:hypothetical protein
MARRSYPRLQGVNVPKRDYPHLAPRDSLVKEIQSVLDLVEPHDYGNDLRPGDGRYDGYCGAATEAYLHLAGGRDSGLRVKRLGHETGSHWWLEDADGFVIDLTLGPADHRYLKKHPKHLMRYEDGRGKMFMGGYMRPSKRAVAIMELVKGRRTLRPTDLRSGTAGRSS